MTDQISFHQGSLFSHAVASEIPQADPEVQILLLLGRDLKHVHKVKQPDDGPFAQRLDFGSVIVGEVCINSACTLMHKEFNTDHLRSPKPHFPNNRAQALSCLQ